jgi:hypothetical protein
MLREPIENCRDGEERKQRQFFELSERFRTATHPEEVELLGDQMGHMVFGGGAPALHRENARAGE